MGLYFQFSSVQSLSRVRLFATPWIAASQASLSITNSRSSLRFSSIESVIPSSRLTLGRPLLLLPPIPPSIRVFSNESTPRMRCPNYWSFSLSIIPSKEIPGLVSFPMGWLALLEARGALYSDSWTGVKPVHTRSMSLSPCFHTSWSFSNHRGQYSNCLMIFQVTLPSTHSAFCLKCPSPFLHLIRFNSSFKIQVWLHLLKKAFSVPLHPQSLLCPTLTSDSFLHVYLS